MLFRSACMHACTYVYMYVYVYMCICVYVYMSTPTNPGRRCNAWLGSDAAIDACSCELEKRRRESKLRRRRLRPVRTGVAALERVVILLSIRGRASPLKPPRATDGSKAKKRKHERLPRRPARGMGWFHGLQLVEGACASARLSDVEIGRASCRERV